MFSSLFQWAIFALVSFWLTKWKEKQLEKVSIRWKSRDNYLFRLSKARNISFKWLFVFTIGLLIFKYCLEIRLSELKIVDFNYFHFLFILFLDLGLEVT